MSCSLRDAVTLEGRGIPTVILANDVFRAIAHATAALVALPAGYVDASVVWLPHPTSNLTREAAAALVDERIERIRSAFSQRGADGAPAGPNGARTGDPLTAARRAIDGLAQSLRADGADLVLVDVDGGTLRGELRIGDLQCDDGACIMPADTLAAMVAALVRPHAPEIERVCVREVRLA